MGNNHAVPEEANFHALIHSVAWREFELSARIYPFLNSNFVFYPPHRKEFIPPGQWCLDTLVLRLGEVERWGANCQDARKLVLVGFAPIIAGVRGLAGHLLAPQWPGGGANWDPLGSLAALAGRSGGRWGTPRKTEMDANLFTKPGPVPHCDFNPPPK